MTKFNNRIKSLFTFDVYKDFLFFQYLVEIAEKDLSVFCGLPFLMVDFGSSQAVEKTGKNLVLLISLRRGP